MRLISCMKKLLRDARLHGTQKQRKGLLAARQKLLNWTEDVHEEKTHKSKASVEQGELQERVCRLRKRQVEMLFLWEKSAFYRKAEWHQWLRGDNVHRCRRGGADGFEGWMNSSFRCEWHWDSTDTGHSGRDKETANKLLKKIQGDTQNHASWKKQTLFSILKLVNSWGKEFFHPGKHKIRLKDKAEPGAPTPWEANEATRQGSGVVRNFRMDLCQLEDKDCLLVIDY